MADNPPAAGMAGEPEIYMNDSAKELLAKIRFIENNDPAKTIDRFYAILSILDAKASGLLSANALFIAVVTFLFGPSITGTDPNHTGNALAVFSYIDLFFFGASSGYCLWIVRMTWPFMAKMKAKGAGYDIESEQPYLAREASRRTGFYRAAWSLTLLGLVLTAFLVFPKGA